MTKASTLYLRHPFVAAVQSALTRHCGLPRLTRGRLATEAPRRVLVAVSGGADSVALLRALAFLAPARPWRLDLAVGHVHHHLRSQGDADAAFVADLAQALGLPYVRADLGPADFPRGSNLEASARRGRYAALLDMARVWQARWVAVGHQADDQLETLLMRLLRGASLPGLGGMAWRRRLDAAPTGGCDARQSPVWLIRPLLGQAAQSTREFLMHLGQPWCEDHTNADCSRLRARLRHDVTPHLRRIAPHLTVRVTAVAGDLRQAAGLLEDEVERAVALVQPAPNGWRMDRTLARGLRPLVLGGLLRRLLRQAGVPADRLSRHALQPILHAVRGHEGRSRRFQFTGGVSICVDRESVRILIPPGAKVPPGQNQGATS